MVGPRALRAGGALQPKPRVDRPAAERAIADLIRALGLDPRQDPELDRTPARIAEFYAEVFAGLDPDGSPDLATFPHEDGGLVVVRGLRFHSLCVHHFAPFFGRGLVAYLPSDRIIGISGPARLLDYHARKPQLQERLTADVAEHLERLVQPRGVAVVLEARHLCMEMRGIRSPGKVETRVVRGELAQPAWQAQLQLGPA